MMTMTLEQLKDRCRGIARSIIDEIVDRQSEYKGNMTPVEPTMYEPDPFNGYELDEIQGEWIGIDALYRMQLDGVAGDLLEVFNDCLADLATERQYVIHDDCFPPVVKYHEESDMYVLYYGGEQ